VKHRLFECFRGIQGGTCAFVLAFLLIPYLVDVAYYGDFTPTHYAQENISLDDDDRSDAQESLICPVDQQDTGGNDSLQHAEDHVAYKLDQSIVPPEHLFIISLTSRPPPTL